MTTDSNFNHATIPMPPSPERRRRVLVVAGSDPSGGAGVQGDIKTCMANGTFAMGVITALTVQNTLGVESFSEVSADMIAAQMECVVKDINPDAVKIGMLPSEEAVKSIAGIIRKYDLRNVIVDPVLVSSSGKTLSKDARITGEAMIKHLFPLATLVTPNIPEACFLSEKNPEENIHPENLAKELQEKWRCEGILLKGGHSDSNECTDILYSTFESKASIKKFTSERIITRNSHGTGCALSSAIASYLAKGYDVAESVAKGKEFVTAALKGNAGVIIGHGHGPLDFFAMNSENHE